MKIGDVVVYTRNQPRPLEPDWPRYVVIGVIPETDSENELIWVSSVSSTYSKPECSLDEAGDYVVVDDAR